MNSQLCLHKLMEDIILPNLILNELDADAILDKWDSDKESETEFNKLIELTGKVTSDQVDLVRETAFKKVFGATKSHDLSAYICEDLGLIVRCAEINIRTKWLEIREAIYLDGSLPYFRST